jgi:hypothetical protein
MAALDRISRLWGLDHSPPSDERVTPYAEIIARMKQAALAYENGTADETEGDGPGAG